MKFTIMFKDPDGVCDSLDDEAKKSVNAIAGLDDDERELVIEARREFLRRAVEPWVEYGEYLEVEFDTDAETATVLKVKK